jgi:hypothetical protein
MQNTFEEKRKNLLDELQMLALKHNRDYYISIIPLIESATADQADIIDMYQSALEEGRSHLLQSRDALITVQKINSLI